jgi:small subunit ribosomal protein S9
LEETLYSGTGKRKKAIARVWIKPGVGNIFINDKSLEDYFGRETLKTIVKQPLSITNTINQYDINVNVQGGGISGQAEAIRHGLARALLKVNENFRDILKKSGLLKRDARIKERKKYGQRGARARFQYSKR